MFQAPKRVGFTLPSVEQPTIFRDPPKELFTRKSEKVNISDTLHVASASDRLDENINWVPRGVDPAAGVQYSNGAGMTPMFSSKAQGYSPYRVAKDGAFRPPMRRQEDDLPLSRMPRLHTSLQTNPGSEDITARRAKPYMSPRESTTAIGTPLGGQIQVPVSAPLPGWGQANMKPSTENYVSAQVSAAASAPSVPLTMPTHGPPIGQEGYMHMHMRMHMNTNSPGPSVLSIPASMPQAGSAAADMVGQADMTARNAGARGAVYVPVAAEFGGGRMESDPGAVHASVPAQSKPSVPLVGNTNVAGSLVETGPTFAPRPGQLRAQAIIPVSSIANTYAYVSAPSTSSTPNHARISNVQVQARQTGFQSGHPALGGKFPAHAQTRSVVSVASARAGPGTGTGAGIMGGSEMGARAQVFPRPERPVHMLVQKSFQSGQIHTEGPSTGTGQVRSIARGTGAPAVQVARTFSAPAAAPVAAERLTQGTGTEASRPRPRPAPRVSNVSLNLPFGGSPNTGGALGRSVREDLYRGTPQVRVPVGSGREQAVSTFRPPEMYTQSTRSHPQQAQAFRPAVSFGAAGGGGRPAWTAPPVSGSTIRQPPSASLVAPMSGWSPAGFARAAAPESYLSPSPSSSRPGYQVARSSERQNTYTSPAAMLDPNAAAATAVRASVLSAPVNMAVHLPGAYTGAGAHAHSGQDDRQVLRNVRDDQNRPAATNMMVPASFRSSRHEQAGGEHAQAHAHAGHVRAFPVQSQMHTDLRPVHQQKMEDLGVEIPERAEGYAHVHGQKVDVAGLHGGWEFGARRNPSWSGLLRPDVHGL